MIASYGSPDYVERVAEGLRKTGQFDAVLYWHAPSGWLWFYDVNGDVMTFSPFSMDLVAAYVPGDELIDE